MALSLETATLPGSGRHPFVQLNPEARHVEGSVPHTMPDGMLISRIATGDRLAMRLLYARHHVRVFRFVLRVARDRAMAEDLTSDVFLDVWRQAGRFEGRSAVTTWLLKIAHYKTLKLKVAITELDVRMDLPESGVPTAEQLQTQATYYKTVLDACLAVDGCNSFTLWGFTDKYSWVPVFFPTEGAATVMWDNFERKPAYYTLRDTLAAARCNR